MSLGIAVVVVSSGALGLFIGRLLNARVVPVFARVPRAHDERFPHCEGKMKPWSRVPIAGWLVSRGRCPSCGGQVSGRYPLVEAGTAVLFATVAWLVLARSTGSPPAALVVLVAFLYFAAISVALTLIDLDNHRLPDQIVLPGYAIALALFALASALGAGWTHFAGAVVGMALLFAFYFLLRLIRPDGMGGGDVKLAGVVGIHLGWLGWSSLAVGAMAAFLLGGAFGVALMAGRRADRRTAIPFGPWMLAGAWLGIVLGPLLGDWYIDQLGI